MPLLKARIDPLGRPTVALRVLPPAHHMARLAGEGQPQPQPRLIIALVDTGATQSHVEKTILDDFGLAPVGQTTLNTGTSGAAPVLADIYPVLLFHGDTGDTGSATLAWNLPVVAATDLSHFGVQGLLGRDVLGRCLLVYDSCEGLLTIAYDVPKMPYGLGP